MSCFEHKKKFVLFLALLFTIYFLMSGKVFPQTTLVTLDGLIADEEGTGLPGVAIKVKNMETGYIYTATTRPDGQYIISGIQPGKYEIEVSLSGFAREIRGGLIFNVGSRLTINFTLKSATIEEEVTVTASAPMVEVTKSEISSVVDRKKIDDLPLIDRDYEALTLLKAGTQRGPQMGEGGGSHYSGFRANAMPRGYGEMLIDGVSNETTPYGKTRSDIPADAIQEFRVITNQFQAEYGNSSELLRSAITRSGTNDLRGRISFFYRDEVFDDVNYFVNHKTYKGEKLPEDQWKKPPYDLYRFGGVLGGPIKKDKAHFFVAYEGFRSTTYSTITSPLVSRETVDVPRSTNQFLVKLDYQLNEKNIFSFRYGFDNYTTKNLGVGGYSTMDRIRDDFDKRHDFQVNWTFFPSDKTMNELRFLYGYSYVYSTIPEKWLDEKGIKKLDSYSIIRPSGSFGPSSGHPMFEKTGRYQLVDNFSVFLGEHSIKFGVDVSRTPWHNGQPSGIPGGFTFLTDKPFNAKDSTTYPYRFSYNVGNPDIVVDYYLIGAFVQDTWRIHRRLTLNIGLRYSVVYSDGIDLDKWDIRNLNPRFGFSWDPVGDGKTSIRGGIGTFTANPTANIAGYTVFMSRMKGYTIMFPNYPDPFKPNPFFPPQPGAVSTVIFNAKKDQIAPYTLQTTLGFQREVFSDFSLGADLVWARGYYLMYQTETNPVIPGTYFIRVNPALGSIRTVVDNGKSDYKALMLTASKRFSKGWALEIAYTLSRSMSDTESEFSGSQYPYEDPQKTRMYGPASMDARHRLATSGIFDLPFGFQLSALFYYVSPTPWNAVYNLDVNKDGLTGDYVDDHLNSRSGFDEYYLNARISKYINIMRFRLQLFAEGYNITNRGNFTNVYGRYGTANFGLPLAAGSPREIQFGIRLDW